MFLNILFIISLIIFVIPSFVGFVYILYLIEVYGDTIEKRKDTKGGTY